MMGVCTYRKPRSWKKVWVAVASALRMRATAPMVLVLRQGGQAGGAGRQSRNI